MSLAQAYKEEAYKQVQDKLDATEFVIEANSFEHLRLWERLHNTYEWNDDGLGYLETVGTLDDMPVCISLRWSTVNGMRMLFWHPTSTVVDHRLIDKFFEEKCNPKYDNGSRRANTDSMNFHHAIHASINKKKAE